MKLALSLPRRSASVLLCASVLALPACSGSDDPSESGDTSGGPAAETGTEAESGGPAPTTDASTTGGETGSESGQASETSVADAPTWHQDIAPIIVGRCAGCHRDGGIAPFSFETYEGTSPLAEAIAATVGSGSMPPWGADETEECAPRLPFKDDLRVSDADLALLQEWADAGAPEGDAATPAEIPAPPLLQLANVDQRLELTSEVTIDGGNDQFLCFSLDPELTEDQFLKAIQIVPDNDKIVHHVLIYVDEDGATASEDGAFPCSGGSLAGNLIAAWAPGALPNENPPDTGMLVPAGARIVMNVHYHPTGLGPEVDAETAIELDWHEERPLRASTLQLIGNYQDERLMPGPNDEGGAEFRIPAGETQHTEEMVYVVPDGTPELQIWQVGTHMHYVGVDMILGIRPAGSSETECLLQTPRYDFQWQRGYVYDAPLAELPSAKGGDEIYIRCTYDNSVGNASLVDALSQQGLDAPVDVYLGEETLDEMCLGVFGISFPNVL